MARLLFATHDPGGANLLLPTMRLARRHGHDVSMAAMGPAVATWRTAGETVAEGAPSLAPRPDLVVTGAGAGDFERDLWRLARARGVRTLAALDSWSQLERRFIGADGKPIHPEAAVTVDEAMAASLRALPGWSARVHVGGQPHLESVAGQLKEKRRGHAPGDPPRLVFFSECLREDYPGQGAAFDQLAIGRVLLDAIDACAPVRLAIKPHPRESAAPWRALIGGRAAVPGVTVEIAQGSAEDLVVAADGIVGKTTMMLLEAALAGVPILSLRPGHPGPIHPMIDGLPDEIVTEAAGAPAALRRLVAKARRPGAASIDAGNLGAMIRDATARTLAAIEREAAGTP